MFDNVHMGSRHRRKKVAPPLTWRELTVIVCTFLFFGVWFVRSVVVHGIRRPRLGPSYHNYVHASRKPDAPSTP